MAEPAIIQDTGVAESIWKSLVQPANLYDEWAIRVNFLDVDEYTPHLLTDNPDRPGALLPLQRKIADDSLSFIGSPFLERNRGFCSTDNADALAGLYRALPDNANLDDISGADPACSQAGFQPSDPAYILDRTSLDYRNRDSLYQFLPRNIRENLRKIGKQVSSGDITVTDAELDFTLERITHLQRARFGADSWLESPFIHRAISRLGEITGSINGCLSCILMLAGNEVIAGCISVYHRDTCYMLMEGVNSQASFSGLGSYLHFHCMSDAFERGCDHIDTGIGDCGWKDRWGLRALPQYRFDRFVSRCPAQVP